MVHDQSRIQALSIFLLQEKQKGEDTNIHTGKWFKYEVEG